MNFRKAKYDVLVKQMLLADQQLRVAHIQERVWASLLVIIQDSTKKIKKKTRNKKK